jgi:hypothetical protein
VFQSQFNVFRMGSILSPRAGQLLGWGYCLRHPLIDDAGHPWSVEVTVPKVVNYLPFKIIEWIHSPLVMTHIYLIVH